MIGNDWDEKLKLVGESEGFKKFWNMIKKLYKEDTIYPDFDNIFNALKEGCFYSSMGPTIKYLYYDSETKKIYLECSEAVNIIFVGCNRTFMHCLGENLTKAEFEIFDDEEYFRITVRDKYGKSAHTRAYFVDEFR